MSPQAEPFSSRDDGAKEALHATFSKLSTVQANRSELLEEFWRTYADEQEEAGRALDEWLVETRGLPLGRGEPIPWFDLLVSRWVSEERVAFQSGNERLSYADLERETARKARRWQSAGVTQGSVVGLGHAFGSEFLVDLLASFRTGACAVWIPPFGETYERRALARSVPQFTSGVDAGLLGEFPELTPLPSEWEPSDLSAGFGSPKQRCAAYDPKAPCLLVLSPLESETGPELPPSAASLPSGRLLRSLGRDASFAWQLRPGDRLAAVGFDEPRYQPALMLACLLAGACYEHVSLEDADQGLELAHGAYRAFGVRSVTVETMLASERCPAVDTWFRDLEEVREIPASPELEARFRRGAVSVACDATLGGVALIAVEQGTPILRSYPPVGVGLELEAIPGSAPGDSMGIAKLEGAASPYMLVSREGAGWAYWGTRDARRDGQTFPISAVIAAVEPLPLVLGATVIAVPGVGKRSDFRFGLLVFVSAPGGSWAGARRELVQHVLSKHVKEVLARQVRPDFVDVFPFAPHRTKKGMVDAEWARVEWLQGNLARRAQAPVFGALARFDIAWGGEV